MEEVFFDPSIMKRKAKDIESELKSIESFGETLIVGAIDYGKTMQDGISTTAREIVRQIDAAVEAIRSIIEPKAKIINEVASDIAFTESDFRGGQD